MTKQQKEIQEIILRLQEAAERFEYKQRRPLISINPKYVITFLVVLELVIQGVILYKVF